MEDSLTSYLRGIIAGIVTKPDQIEIERSTDEQGVLFVVKVAPDERGKVIGKKGAIAQAIRTLLRAAGYKEDSRCSMKIDAPGSNYKVEEDEAI